jgi:hypothetical protein
MGNEATTIDILVEVDCNNVDDFLLLSLCSAELIRKEKIQAAMTSMANNSVRVIKDKSVAMVDFRASVILTGLQPNTTNSKK